MEAARSKTAAPAPAPAPAPAAHPVRTAVPSGSVQLQSALKVSSPSDPAEKEAESTARKVVRLPAPEPTARPLTLQSPQSPHVARFRDAMIQRKAEGQPNVASNVAAEIATSTASGSPLPPTVRRFMEPRFKADFGNVRVHTGERSARLNRQLNAQAFTVGNQIFFGRGRFRPESTDGQELLAHELTHTIQQGAVSQGIQRSADVSVTEQSPQQVQRLGISDALDYFADKAYLIPGFRMFTVILGVNPINMSRVERSAANVLRAVIELLPGGALITQALDNHGVFDRVGAWVEQQIRTLGMTGSLIGDAISRFLDSLSWTDIFDLGGVWERAKRIFTEPIDRILSFARGLVSGIIGFIKDAILRPLGRLAEGTRGYDLLKAVLGYDPVTGDPYPRNAETLIGGFMRLIGQEEIWQNVQRSGAVARAWAWFQGALSGLLGFVRQIPSLFLQAFRSLEIADVILLPRAFARIASVFGGFLGQFFSWAGNTIWNLLEIIFSVVAPGVMVYLRRAAGAFRTILRNPIGFVGNLVRAGILGLRQFATRFLTHLRASLIGWLTGAMSGANVYVPQGFNLREILKFVLSVLGLTWQNIRQKLVRAIGEPAVRVLETSFDIVMTLVTQGPAAAWEKIQESLANLRDLVMEQIMTFVRDRVVQAAITRLLTSLNPAGAFIQAVIAIYNTVMFFIERLRQIGQVAMSFIDSISAIAGGALGAAANRVEQTMAGLLTLVISFLARIAGLGRVSDAVTSVIDRVRQPIDRALDRVVEWIVAQARRLGRLAVAGVQRVVGWWRIRKPFTARDGTSHTLFFQGEGRNASLTVATTPAPVNTFLVNVRTAALASTIPGVVSTYNSAVTLAARIDTLRATVESGTNPRQPADVDLLNQELTRMATLLPVLIPLLSPGGGSPAPSGPAPVAVGDLIKVRSANRIALITDVNPSGVFFKYVRPGMRSAVANQVFAAIFAHEFGSEYTRYVDDPRDLYMGPTPDKTSSTGTAVRNRMRTEGKLRVTAGAEEVFYMRNPTTGAPAATGIWWPVADCDMGHIIDTVTWWNSNGRLTGPQSSEVLAFMNSSINYEFEPSGPNRARGARLGQRYLPPV
jgi:dolichol kinase